MFGIDWNDPQTIWLNLTNVTLGLVMLACVAALGGSFLVEIRRRWQLHARGMQIDREVGQFFGKSDPHVLHVPELGLTMADGGEPADTPNPAEASKPKKTR